MCTRERVSFSCPWTCPSATGWTEERKGNVWKNVGYGWKGELIGARDTDPWTRLVLSLFWRTRSFLGIMCVYKKRKNIVSHGWDSKGAAAHRLGPKDGQRLWGRENVSLDNFEKKLSSTRVRIHDIISFFFLNRCMEFLGEGERESHRYFMEVEETRFETRVDRENVGLSLRLIKCVAQRDIYIYIKCT